MQEIKAYKLSTGKIVESKEEAFELDAKEMLYQLDKELSYVVGQAKYEDGLPEFAFKYRHQLKACLDNIIEMEKELKE